VKRLNDYFGNGEGCLAVFYCCNAILDFLSAATQFTNSQFNFPEIRFVVFQYKQFWKSQLVFNLWSHYAYAVRS